MRKRGLAFFILLAVAAAGLVWSLREVFPRSVQEVEGVRIKRGTLELTLPVTGIFETRTVELAFDAPGRLTTVAVRGGDRRGRGGGGPGGRCAQGCGGGGRARRGGGEIRPPPGRSGAGCLPGGS